VKAIKLAALGVLCCASVAHAQSFLEVINGTERRTAFAVTGTSVDPVGIVVGRLRHDLDLQPGEAAYLTFTVLGLAGQNGAASFSMPGATLTGSTYSMRVTSDGMTDFRFSRADGRSVTNGNNASWQDMSFGIALDADRMGGRLFLEDALLGNDFDYNDLTVRFQMRVAPIPEPSTYALAMAGLGVLALVRRRRSSSNSSQS
jgi:hypothetical protein